MGNRYSTSLIFVIFFITQRRICNFQRIHIVAVIFFGVEFKHFDIFELFSRCMEFLILFRKCREQFFWVLSFKLKSYIFDSFRNNYQSDVTYTDFE